MPSIPRPGALILAFDLGESAPSLGRAVQGPREELAVTLLAMLDRRCLRATWGVGDPASCNFAARLNFDHREHELALRADQAWAGRGANRLRIATELRQRLNRARAIGCNASTLLLSGVRLDQNLDILVKHGITSLLGCTLPSKHGGARTERTGSLPGGASCIRFGLWEVEAT